MEPLFISNDSEKFWQHWNQYISKNISSFRYLQSYVSFMKAYSKNICIDSSFVVIENDIVVGICFLPIEKINGVNSITLSGGYTVGPQATNEKTEKFIYSLIEEIAKKYDVSQIKFYSEPLIEIYTDQYNSFRKFGFIDTSSTDMILSLIPDEASLKTNRRRSYRSLINGILNNKDNKYELLFFDKDNADSLVSEEYRKMHIKAAGRETRSKETFDLQLKMVKEGNGMITALKLNNNFIAFNYFLSHQKTVVYMSAADDPDYADSKTPFYHATLWASIIKLKEMGYEYIQFSSPASSHKVEGFLDYSDSKQLDIAFFKKGMGAVRVPFNRGIRYFDKETFLNDLEQFKEQVLVNYFGEMSK